MRAADGDHLPRQVEQELPRERMAADRPDGFTRARRRAGHRDERDVFFPDRATDIVADFGVDPAAPASLVECFDTPGTVAIVLPEHQSLQRACLSDDPRPADAGPDVCDAARERG